MLKRHSLPMIFVMSGLRKIQILFYFPAQLVVITSSHDHRHPIDIGNTSLHL